MKLFKRSLMGLVILSLVMVLLIGCGVSKSEYETLQADYDELNTEYTTLQADYDELNTEYETLQNALAEVEAVYPPKDFPSLTALNDWLLENDVSEKPDTTYADDWYSRALEIQEDALRDGYIVSADYDYGPVEEIYVVWCIAIINGRVFYWDPETDEVFEDYLIGTVK